MNAVPGLYPQSYAISSVISTDTHGVLLRKGAKLARSEAPPACNSLLACSSQGFRREIYASESSLFLPLLCVCGFLNISHLYLIWSYCCPLGTCFASFYSFAFSGWGLSGLGFVCRESLCWRGGSWKHKALGQIPLSTDIRRYHQENIFACFKILPAKIGPLWQVGA